MRDARHIANEFIRYSRERNSPLTNMHIQKLVFFAHARMLSIHRRPLVSQEFEAWTHGPVVPRVYHALRHYGANRVRDLIPLDTQETFSTMEEDIIEWSFSKYGLLHGFALSDLTHSPGSPWRTTKEQQKSIISNALIEQHYAELWRDELVTDAKRISDLPDVRAEVEESMGQFQQGEYVTQTFDELESIVERAGKPS